MRTPRVTLSGGSRPAVIVLALVVVASTAVLASAQGSVEPCGDPSACAAGSTCQVVDGGADFRCICHPGKEGRRCDKGGCLGCSEPSCVRWPRVGTVARRAARRLPIPIPSPAPPEGKDVVVESCQALLNRFPEAESGQYQIVPPRRSASITVGCLFTGDAGFTLLARVSVVGRFKRRLVS